DHRPWRQVEPSYRMESDKEHGGQIQQHNHRILQPMLKRGIGLRSARQRSNLQQQHNHKPGDEYAADLAQNEFQIRPSRQPPPGRNTRSIPARMVLRISHGLPDGAHFALSISEFPAAQGIRKDLNRSIVAVSLYCWMAPVGSTCLGQTFVHSPTKVHPQMPSCWARTSMRSPAPSSRESML